MKITVLVQRKLYTVMSKDSLIFFIYSNCIQSYQKCCFGGNAVLFGGIVNPCTKSCIALYQEPKTPPASLTVS